MTATSDAGAVSSSIAPKPAKPNVLKLDDRGDFGRVCLTAGILTWASGMVNGLALFEFAAGVAAHTGSVLNLGRLFGTDAARLVPPLLGWVGGGAVAGFADCDGDSALTGRGSPGLLCSAATIAAGVGLYGSTNRKQLTLVLWSFAIGLQNGITSKFSSMAIRSSHVTGALTDLGLIVGHMLRSFVHGRHELSPKQSPPLRKLIVLLVGLCSFVSGGFCATRARRAGIPGVVAALFPAVVVAALATGAQVAAVGDSEKRQ
eukprot:TRINITY_DN15565_c0_g1_i1.p1 TRINITY_DN15565_c0_g1~~TRINITY_DN15565_c0_g1_i1.p1  ORF type:complete len:260 (+),score=33.58 TRINITY_DN15565_c0_g1_i1:71-850(+)